jgi:prolyl 4-hydroxylase
MQTDLIEIEDFLSEEECEYFIRLIEQKNRPSTVCENYAAHETSYRTSSTADLSTDDNKVFSLKSKISEYLNIPYNKGETLQGQKYAPGQYFKQHNDYFHGSSYETECLYSGNRTHTLMIYLNDVEEGGETSFINLNKKIKAKMGKAVIWTNMENGRANDRFLHEGCEVKKGVKYIITSWWRENEWNSALDRQKFEKKGQKIFSSYEQLPKFSSQGFKIVKCPEDTWQLIQKHYELLKDQKKEEVFQGKENIIKGSGITSEIMPMDIYPDIIKQIHANLKPLHEEFAGTSLESTWIYGIRSYLNGATLAAHRDRIETHHISSILIVDKDLNNKPDWPLDIQDHNGEWQKIYAQTGDLILYESAKCEHARLETFQGNWFRNLFIHYKLNDYNFIRE